MVLKASVLKPSNNFYLTFIIIRKRTNDNSKHEQLELCTEFQTTDQG